MHRICKIYAVVICSLRICVRDAAARLSALLVHMTINSN